MLDFMEPHKCLNAPTQEKRKSYLLSLGKRCLNSQPIPSASVPAPSICYAFTAFNCTNATIIFKRKKGAAPHGIKSELYNFVAVIFVT